MRIFWDKVVLKQIDVNQSLSFFLVLYVVRILVKILDFVDKMANFALLLTYFRKHFLRVPNFTLLILEKFLTGIANGEHL